MATDLNAKIVESAFYNVSFFFLEKFHKFRTNQRHFLRHLKNSEKRKKEFW